MTTETKIKNIFKKLRKHMNNGETDYVVSKADMKKAYDKIMEMLR